MRKNLSVLGVAALALGVGLLLAASAPPRSSLEVLPETPRPESLYVNSYGYSFDPRGLEIRNLEPERPIAEAAAIQVVDSEGSALTIAVHDPNVWPDYHSELRQAWSQSAADQALSLWQRNSMNAADAAADSMPQVSLQAKTATTTSLENISFINVQAYTFTVSGLFRDFHGGLSVLAQPHRLLLIETEPYPIRLMYPLGSDELRGVLETMTLE